MNKLVAFFFACILFFCTITGVDFVQKKYISANKIKYMYWNTDGRNNCEIALKTCFKNGIPIFGSSELHSGDEIAYPRSLLHAGYSDFNMILFGRGYMQSLLHAINVGSLADDIPEKKCVLILSPQWFEGRYSIDAFPSRLLERRYVAFLKNPNISLELKKRIVSRVLSLMEKDPEGLEKVKRYNNVFLNRKYILKHPIISLECLLYDSFMEMKSTADYVKEVNSLNKPISNSFVLGSTIDWNKLLVDAMTTGNDECTNNNLYIYNDYYNTYVKDKYENNIAKNSCKNSNMYSTDEYDDLCLFLDVCVEVGIQPLIVSIPVNGRWYDFTGFPKSEREQYYQHIREICTKYNVPIADFSDKEYEEYFLRDIMHIGWKGWVYVDEAVYSFYNKK